MDEVERARDAQRAGAWNDAYDVLSAIDLRDPLGANELELLATSAYLIGRDEECFAALERAHQAFLHAGERTRAARCGFWLGLFLLLRGELGRATAWLGRAQRLADEQAQECVEHGYLLIPAAEQQLAAGDWTAAHETASRSVAIGERFRDPDLTACARHLQGRALLGGGNVQGGLALLDEAMLAATSGELSPILSGLLYCSVIDSCLRVYAFSRAREWTTVLAAWCERQPQMVAFRGSCVVHRAQVMRLHGGWQEAIAEVRSACDRFERGIGQSPPGGAFYEQGEVHRLRGELDAAERAYRAASQAGCEPQPGLALLRNAQGRADAATAALHRVLAATTDDLQRTRLLSAFVEVLLSSGDIGKARSVCDELQNIAERFPSDALLAISAQARAAVLLSEGGAATAVVLARQAWQLWTQIEAPYLGARARELVGMGCGALGDADGYRLELEAARTTFEQLGATPDAARIDALLAKARPRTHDPAHRSGLTARELEVLRLVAAGKTNRAIAGALRLSEKTIERHLSNMFQKLGVSTRSAATAYAYEHGLV